MDGIVPNQYFSNLSLNEKLQLHTLEVIEITHQIHNKISTKI